jgi:dihydroneopterin aldolase
MISSYSSQLVVEKFETLVHLGCEAAERRLPQKVHFNCKITFKNLPKAVETDELKDSICYADLCAEFKKTSESKHFKLIEHLAHCALLKVESLLVTNKETSQPISEIEITVHKLNPPVDDLRGGTFFSIKRTF